MQLGSVFGSGSPVSHGTACIKQDVTTEIGLFLIFPNIESIAFPKDLPVNVSNLIPGNILAVLLELHTEAFVRGAMQAGAKAFHHPFGQHLVVSQASQVLGVQVFRDRGHNVGREGNP
jgi:hypothetical protein